ncbi:rhodanese-like domain-containing protein [Oerskovia gallyi]|uniref:Sulfurtransferase n=1 Tax=Oerskovia gallyi TaxID=2762226 RepID=A0ABR8UZZ4_9CELL|nr:rhodanese-like domain-containing protein [Oerskovia gallyi]MBD7998108.1 sulfurtransferase [Oerskovia gallyi]
MTTSVSDTVKRDIAGYLEAALGRPVDVHSLADDTPLNTLGLDSLLTISVVATLLDESGVDLLEHSDSLVTPSTLADLYALGVRFGPGEDRPAHDEEKTVLENDRIAHYQSKLAYEIDSADLQDALSAGKDVVVVDGRSSDSFAAEHIPGAVSLPHRSISHDSLSELSRAPLYVAYCDGIGCNASTKTALKLAAAGFQVKELIGGLDWWKRDGHLTEGHAAHTVVGEHPLACGCAG